jgi:hypothetical protein
MLNGYGILTPEIPVDPFVRETHCSASAQTSCPRTSVSIKKYVPLLLFTSTPKNADKANAKIIPNNAEYGKKSMFFVSRMAIVYAEIANATGTIKENNPS